MTTAVSPPRLPSLDEVDAELSRRSLREFSAQAWPLVEAQPRRDNWHLDAICEHLEAVSSGEIRRLIVNIPPRHSKSLSVAVFWPTWDWLTRPERRWLFSSYAEKLSKRDSLKCRRIVESRGGRLEDGTLLERIGYRGLLRLLGEDWELTSDQNEKLRFENSRTGYRIATSIGGTATGEGGDILVLDDPHKVDGAESEVQRESVLDWIDGTLSTRLNDPTTGAIVVVMQRLHEDDATGHLLEQGGYEHLCLPAEYEPSHPFIWPKDPRQKPGELLWPNHFDEAAMKDLKLRLASSYRIAGQLQQRPSPAEGGIFKREWWQLYPPLAWPQVKKVVQSWDLAFGKTDHSDYVVGQLWGADLANRYLLAQVRARLDFPDMLDAVRAMTSFAQSHGFGTHPIIVEATAAGKPLIASLKREIPGLIPQTTSTDKVVRANAEVAQVESGNVYLPDGFIPAPPDAKKRWGPTPTDTFIEEHAAFPNAAHDDQVDAETQALKRLASGGETRKARTV